MVRDISSDIFVDEKSNCVSKLQSNNEVHDADLICLREENADSHI